MEAKRVFSSLEKFASLHDRKYILSGMKESELGVVMLKSEFFDQIIEKYQNLQDDAGFYSKNWVELSEMIEDRLRKLKQQRL